MSVEAVNNNNTTMYTAGGALAGAAIGGTIGHVTKSVLKDGNYTDEFVRTTHKNLMNSDEGKLVKEICQIEENSPTALTECYNAIRKYPKALGLDPQEVAKASGDVALAQMFGGNDKVLELIAGAKDSIKNKCGEELKFGKDTNIEELVKKYVPGDLDEVFDRSKNAFKDGVKESENSLLNPAKKAFRSIKLKAAGIYGAIGAAVLGVAGYLFASNKNQDKPQEPQG